MLKTIQEKGIETSIKLKNKKSEIINRSKEYINNNKGEVPAWGKLVLGLIAMAALLTIIVLGYKWATENFGKATTHVDTELDNWLR